MGTPTEPTAAELVAKLGEIGNLNYKVAAGEGQAAWRRAWWARDAYTVQAVNFYGPLVAALEIDHDANYHLGKQRNVHADHCKGCAVLAAVAEAAKEALGP